MLMDRLLHDHTKLRSLGADLVTLVSSPNRCDMSELARCRWDVARMVHMHLAYEERQLFAPLVTDPRPDVRAAAAEAKRGVERLHVSYREHVKRWNAQAVTDDWPRFQISVRKMVARMVDKLDREEADLFPLVAHDAEADRRWQPGMRNWAGDGVALRPFICGAAPRYRPACHTSTNAHGRASGS